MINPKFKFVGCLKNLRLGEYTFTDTVLPVRNIKAGKIFHLFVVFKDDGFYFLTLRKTCGRFHKKFVSPPFKDFDALTTQNFPQFFYHAIWVNDFVRADMILRGVNYLLDEREFNDRVEANLDYIDKVYLQLRTRK